MMDIVKQNETFALQDTTEAFEMKGTATYEVAGGLTIHFNLVNPEGEYFGDCSYYKYADGDRTNFNLNVAEARRVELSEYADSVITSMLEYLKAAN